MPAGWADWPREGKIAYLSNTHNRADFATTIGAALGFEPNNPERFTVGELALLVYARHHASDDAGLVQLGNARQKLVEQLATLCDLMIHDAERIDEYELAAVLVAFEAADFRLLKDTVPSNAVDMDPGGFRGVDQP